MTFVSTFGRLIWFLYWPWLGSGICEHQNEAVDPPERPDEANDNHTQLIEGEPILNHLGLNKSKMQTSA